MEYKKIGDWESSVLLNRHGARQAMRGCTEVPPEAFGGFLGSLWEPLGASWESLEASWVPLGSSWEPLGASWGVLGGSWEALGAS